MTVVVDPVSPPLKDNKTRYTGRSLVLFERDVHPQHVMQVYSQASAHAAPEKPARWLDEIQVGVFDIPYEVLQDRFAPGTAGIVAVAPERISFIPPGNVEIDPDPIASPADPLDVMNVTASQRSGNGIRVGMIDSGFARRHPDFAGRDIIMLPLTQSLLPRIDVTGHGTHTTGLACGPRVPAAGARYGVAYETDIFISRVVDEFFRIPDDNILAAMTIAAINGCHVVAMCLGAGVLAGDESDDVFDGVARRLMENFGVVFIAAAGNDDVGILSPVNHPANCPSIMGVAALGPTFEAWDRSCGGAGQVDVAAPGYRIRSSTNPTGYEIRSGTSMAAAYATGVAALWAEETGLRGRALFDEIKAAAKPILDANGAPVSPDLVGAGLLQAP